jgi:hypothetical protein
MTCDREELEALAAGEPREALAAHVETCASCKEELRWLRVERELMDARAARAPSGDALWRGVASRIGAARPRFVWRRALLYSIAVAAAACLAFLAGRRAAERTAPMDAPPQVALRLDPGAALDTAEAQYRAAAATLEQRWLAERARLPPLEAARLDADFARTRRQLDEARRLDPPARQALLENCAANLRSLGRAVSDLEANR